jgi:hypothetical protein
LLRFPEKRKQLMETGVPGLINLTEAITIGKNQYIVPENTLAWQDLWRMDWAPKEKEEAKYYEEISVAPPMETKAKIEEGAKPPPPAGRRQFKIALAKPGGLPQLEALRIGEPDVQRPKTPPPESPKAEAPVIKRQARIFKIAKMPTEAEVAPAVPVLTKPDESVVEPPKKSKFKIAKPIVTEAAPPPPPALLEQAMTVVEEAPPPPSLEEPLPVPKRTPPPLEASLVSRTPTPPPLEQTVTVVEEAPPPAQRTSPPVLEPPVEETPLRTRTPTPSPPTPPPPRARTPTPSPPPPPPRARTPTPQANSPENNDEELVFDVEGNNNPFA